MLLPIKANMRTLKIAIIFGMIGVVSIACKRRDENNIKPSDIVRLDQKIALMRDTTDACDLMSEYNDALSLLFTAIGRNYAKAADLYDYSKTSSYTVFYEAIDKAGLNVDSLEMIFGQIDTAMNKALNGIGIGNLYGVISPYRQWIFTNDSITLIGLNHYLGADFEGYNAFEKYYRRHKSPEYMPYDVLEARLGTLYPRRIDDKSTVLSALVYNGVLTHAKLKLIPDATLDRALGLDAADVEWAADNEKLIWRQLLYEGLLFSTSELDVKRLLSPSAVSSVIAADAPGAIARYIGYKIVENYMNEMPDTSLSDLLSPAFYNDPSVLAKSRYNPR